MDLEKLNPKGHAVGPAVKVLNYSAPPDVLRMYCNISMSLFTSDVLVVSPGYLHYSSMGLQCPFPPRRPNLRSGGIALILTLFSAPGAGPPYTCVLVL
jgi:hypothetical protein